MWANRRSGQAEQNYNKFASLTYNVTISPTLRSFRRVSQRYHCLTRRTVVMHARNVPKDATTPAALESHCTLTVLQAL